MRELLTLYKMILRAQSQVEDEPEKGTQMNLDNDKVINDLQKYALALKKPIAILLNPSVFDRKSSRHIQERVVGGLLRRRARVRGLKNLLSSLKEGKLNAVKFTAAALSCDIEFFEGYGRKLGVPPMTLLSIASASIQPFLKEVARRVSSSFLEAWWQSSCPVCGRLPVVAKLRARKRYLVCTFCGAEYLADQFLCVNCGNTDPYTLKFLAPEDLPGHRIDFCERCKHYLKVLDEERLKTPIPSGFEDVLTGSLDSIAKQARLVRTGLRTILSKR